MPAISLFAGSVPSNYDRYLGPVLFEPYAVDLASRVKNAKDILEIACGTGRVTRHLAEKIPPEGKLVATDLNPGMIEVAKSQIHSDKIEWKVVNAQDLPFEDESFDHVICQFGVIFFPDKVQSFREAQRVLKKGGSYIFNVWESVERNPRIDTMWKVIAEVFTNEPPEFFQKGPHSFNDKNEIDRMLRNAGFDDVRIETVVKTSHYTGPDDLIKGFADGSPLSSYLQEKDENLQAWFRMRLEEELQQQDEILGTSVPCEAIVIEAVK